MEDKRIAVLVEDLFEDSELMEPVKRLKKAGAIVAVVGEKASKIYTGKKGTTIRSTLSIDRAKIEDFDAILIPGGYAPDKLRVNEKMVNFIKQANRRGKIIAAICHGPQLLITADVLRDRILTSWPSVAIDVKNAGGHYVDKAVVKDANLITSRKPADIPDFVNAILNALTEKKVAYAS